MSAAIRVVGRVALVTGANRGIGRALAQARDRGDLSPAVDVDATATLLVVHNYGLNALAKTGATAGELEAALEALLAGLR